MALKGHITLEEKMLSNESLGEIKDPVSRAKLEGIQESVFATDNEILKAHKELDHRRGVAESSALLAQRMIQECNPIQAAVDNERMEPAEAKIRIDTITKMAELANSISAEARENVTLLKGQIQGMERAVKALSMKFSETAAKYERWQRVQGDDEDELGRSATEGAQGDTQQGTPGQVDVHKAKPTKKVTAKAKPPLKG